MLTQQELDRYNRQLIFPDWGKKTQEQLKMSTVFIAGVGGLGSPVATYLAAAGVGTLRLCDSGRLELSNLNRQTLYNTSDIGRLKVELALDRIHQFNPNVEVIPLTGTIGTGSMETLVGNPDLIVDCLDNFDARHALNRFIMGRGIPMIHAGINGWAGQLTFLCPPETPCLNCLFPDVPNLENVPVIGTTPGMIGTLEAVEAIKYLSGIGPTLKGKLLVWEGDTMNIEIINVSRDPGCLVCSVEGD